MKISIRPQQVSDAKDFFRILNNDNFVYFTSRPKDMEDQIEFLKKGEDKRKKNFEHTYAIIFEDKIIGGGGIKINQHRKHIGEIGYFIDEEYWNHGIATQFVQLVEKIAKEELSLKRLEIVVDPENIASQKVALKNGFKKEGVLSCHIPVDDGYRDSVLLAKII